MEDVCFGGFDATGALVFFRENRATLKTLRRVLVKDGVTTVVDINGRQMVLGGLGLGDAELVALLDLAGASYNPATVHDPSAGTDKTKVFEVIKSDPWGHDRVA